METLYLNILRFNVFFFFKKTIKFNGIFIQASFAFCIKNRAKKNNSGGDLKGYY